MVDNKLNYLKREVSELAEHCSQIGDEKTHQLLLEVAELLDITHSAFLGKALTNISKGLQTNREKH